MAKGRRRSAMIVSDLWGAGQGGPARGRRAGPVVSSRRVREPRASPVRTQTARVREDRLPRPSRRGPWLRRRRTWTSASSSRLSSVPVADQGEYPLRPSISNPARWRDRASGSPAPPGRRAGPRVPAGTPESRRASCAADAGGVGTGN